MKVRFAPSPTGSLHIGNALSAVANRNFGGAMLLRIDDTDPARNVPGGEEAILEDLGWLGVVWDEGPVRQSGRRERYREVLERAGLRFAGLSPDGLLPETVEYTDHPWFIGVQYHPELKSRPFEPHPLFASFIAAAVEQSRLV